MFSNNVERILRLASIYASAKGHALSTVSLRIAGQGKFFERLADDEIGLTLKRRDRIFQEFSDHWPEDLDWPSDIPRPTPNPDRKEAA